MSQRGPQSEGPDRPRYPDLQEEIGEDPARYLSSETDLNPWPRLKGISSLEAASAWLAVARDLEASEKVRTYLEDRRDEIDQFAADGGTRE